MIILTPLTHPLLFIPPLSGFDSNAIVQLILPHRFNLRNCAHAAQCQRAQHGLLHHRYQRECVACISVVLHATSFVALCSALPILHPPHAHIFPEGFRKPVVFGTATVYAWQLQPSIRVDALDANYVLLSETRSSPYFIVPGGWQMDGWID